MRRRGGPKLRVCSLRLRTAGNDILARQVETWAGRQGPRGGLATFATASRVRGGIDRHPRPRRDELQGRCATPALRDVTTWPEIAGGRGLLPSPTGHAAQRQYFASLARRSRRLTSARTSSPKGPEDAEGLRSRVIDVAKKCRTRPRPVGLRAELNRCATATALCRPPVGYARAWTRTASRRWLRPISAEHGGAAVRVDTIRSTRSSARRHVVDRPQQQRAYMAAAGCTNNGASLYTRWSQ